MTLVNSTTEWQPPAPIPSPASYCLQGGLWVLMATSLHEWQKRGGEGWTPRHPTTMGEDRRDRCHATHDNGQRMTSQYPPPALWATACGVDCRWDNDRWQQQQKVVGMENHDSDKWQQMTMTMDNKNEWQGRWPMDNTPPTPSLMGWIAGGMMTTRGAEWWWWQWGWGQDNEDPRTTTMTAPPTTATSNCSWGGNGVQWG
jgi:hypothetical protein